MKKLFYLFILTFIVVTLKAGNPNLFYYVSDGTNQLYSLNRSTSAITLIGSTGVSNIEAIAYYPIPGANVLYAANANTFGTLNLSTGAYTSMGQIDSGGTANGASGAQSLNDVDGLMLDGKTFIMWAIERKSGATPDLLFQIDVTTGQFVPNAFGVGVDYLVITGSGIDVDVDDLAIDPKTGRIYGVSNNNGANDVLIEINKYSGLFTQTATLAQDDVEGIAFSNNGLLYGSEGDSDNRFSLINKSTGAMSGFVSFSGSDVEALACLVADANTVSGTVYDDLDKDGVKDGGEPGISGVTINLYIDNNTNGTIDLADTKVQSKTTDGSGNYTFYYASTAALLVSTEYPSYPFGYALTTDNLEAATFTDNVNFGQVDLNNDFGLATGPDCDGDGIPNFFEGIFDSDGDAVRDSCDVDSDNDGIFDAIEGITDFDDDGVPDYLDRDSDDDGIPDAIEANVGAIPTGYSATNGNVSGADVDGNGMVDTRETAPGSGFMKASNPDSDNDGKKDYKDLDSDNDGILDIIEAGGTDSNGDGQADVTTDANTNGYKDIFETTALAIPNTDVGYEISNSLFLRPNYIDIDSDADGIDDTREGYSTVGYQFPTLAIDSDDDGIIDFWDISAFSTPITPNDHDNDGAPDYIDLNSDNDSRSDFIEGNDANNDGVADQTNLGADSDFNGLDDRFDPACNSSSIFCSSNVAHQDTDGDGEDDFRESDGSLDDDADGITNDIDIDDDNDGILDVNECKIGTKGSVSNPFTTIADAKLAVSSGRYYFDLGSGSFQASVDVSEGGGWVQILQYHHRGGTNPSLNIIGSGSNLPIADNSGIGVNLSADLTKWGHIGNAGMADLTDAHELRWYARAGGHGRVIHFKSSVGISYAKTGVGSFTGINGTFTTLSGHTAFSPASADNFFSNRGNLALTDFPFYRAANNHWGIKGLSNRWEVDDYPNGSGQNTIHKVWVRSDNEPFCDCDNDGIPNRIDLDSDNDGIADIIEAGGVDSDGNGIVDGTFTDTDNDGWSNTFDPDNGGTILTDADTDGDGFENRIDIDSDNDGILDIIESQPTGVLISPSGTDTDGDGIDDNFDPDSGNALTTPENTDGTDNPDYTDTDSDNDGDLDILEGWDTDNDGIADTSPAGTDADNDGLDDNFDSVVGPNNTTNVTDNGKNSSSYPNLDNTGTAERDWREMLDFDNDGISDIFDIDDDNDGVLDTDESCVNESIVTESSNSDWSLSTGFTNGFANFNCCGAAPTEGSQYIHFNSNNASNSGTAYASAGTITKAGIYTFRIDILNFDNAAMPAISSAGIRTGGTNANTPGTLAADQTTTTPTVALGTTLTWIYSVNIPSGDARIGQNIGFSFTVPNTGVYRNLAIDNLRKQVSCDTDNDGIADQFDLDSDNDGIADIIEAGGVDIDGNGIVDGAFTDTDNDGWSNTFDPDNSGTVLTDADTDGDGFNNRIDIDSDNDGILDIIESQPTGALISPSGTDTDGDGIDDNFDPDSGNNLTTPENTDGTDNPDYTDTDSDNDGDFDILEGWDTNNDGLADTGPAGTDSDNDGLDDNFDNVVGPNNTTNVTDNGKNSSSYPNLDKAGTAERDWREALDFDNDGITNIEDIDDDNDGILDENECGIPISKEVFTYTGSNQSYTIPAGVTEIRAKIWGAGGRGDQQPGRARGGAGGYTEFSIPVSSLSNNTLILTVGQGGNSSTGTPTYGNGGAGSFISGRNNGAGGGMSAISYTSISVPNSVAVSDLIAIAGGGGSAPAFSNGQDRSGEGGGLTGNSAINTFEPTASGGGGSQVAGGTSTNGNSGSYLLGGSSILNGSAGGGGFYGGGSGSIVGTNEGCGGGGSGYLSGLVSSGQTLNGSIITPPNTADPDYITGVGIGGTSSAGNGGNGLIILELVYFNCDTDGDGIPNNIDLDSDGDGIADILEAGGIDADGNGVVDGAFTDTDGDGWSNTFDPDNSGKVLNDFDSDNDGFENRLDIDSDNDGIIDIIESQPSGVLISPSGLDTDGDGIDDNFDPNSGNNLTTPINTDGTDYPDYLDTDSDNDRDLDILEAWDTDNDGIADTSPSENDSDNDGLDDNFDTVVGPNNTTNVTDNGKTSGSYPDLDKPLTAERDWREALDNDNDGIPDIDDIDDDNDGILDYDEQMCSGFLLDWDTELALSSNPAVQSVTIDGITLDFGIENNTNVNSSEVGTLNNKVGWKMVKDRNPANDQTAMTINFSKPVLNFSTTIVDIDFASGSFRDNLIFNAYKPDGTLITLTNSNFSTNVSNESVGGNQFRGTGSSFDGPTEDDASIVFYIEEEIDSVRIIYFHTEEPFTAGTYAMLINNLTWDTCENGANLDSDNDGIPNHFDLDSDNDGIVDIIEAGGVDADNDGRVDVVTDTDGDGWANTFDPDNSGTILTDGDKDGDGLANRIDLDADNDGIADIIEAGGVDVDKDGRADVVTDTDSDGWSNTFDSDNSGTALPNPDTDSDGLKNYLDIDSDSDGLTDNVEGQTSLDFIPPLGTDTDMDGWDDQYDKDNGGEAIVLSDNDNAGDPDYTSQDSDGDGMPDYIEGFDDDLDADALNDLIIRANNFEAASSNIMYYVNSDDANSDGKPNWVEDTDGDGIVNFLDIDSPFYRDTDNDGLVDLFDPHNNGVASNLPDQDGDGSPDFRDLDNTIGGLPIILIEFNASKHKDWVELTWITSAEINNDYFTIERSVDGKTFIPILTQEGAGNSTARLDYIGYDYNPEKGYNYYRLRQTDYDGRTEVFDPKAVFFESFEIQEVRLFPNPSIGGNLFVELIAFEEGEYTIQMLSQEFKLIKEETITINNSELPFKMNVLNGKIPAKGVYYMRIIGQNEMEIRKFIVQ